MPAVTTPEQLFEHELQDMYYAEKTLTKVLPKLADEASDARAVACVHGAPQADGEARDEPRAGLPHDRQDARGTPMPGHRGHQEGARRVHGRERPTSAKMLDAFLTGAAARTEHYEIAALHRPRQPGARAAVSARPSRSCRRT